MEMSPDGFYLKIKTFPFTAEMVAQAGKPNVSYYNAYSAMAQEFLDRLNKNGLKTRWSAAAFPFAFPHLPLTSRTINTCPSAARRLQVR